MMFAVVFANGLDDIKWSTLGKCCAFADHIIKSSNSTYSSCGRWTQTAMTPAKKYSGPI